RLVDAPGLRVANDRFEPLQERAFPLTLELERVDRFLPAAGTSDRFAVESRARRRLPGHASKISRGRRQETAALGTSTTSESRRSQATLTRTYAACGV